MLTFSRFVQPVSIIKLRNLISIFGVGVRPAPLSHKCRNVHTTGMMTGKMYMENENRYAYKVMENKGYTNSLDVTNTKKISLTYEEFNQLLAMNCSCKETTEIFEIFSTLCEYSSENNVCISNKIFDDYIDTLTDNIKKASDEQLEALFITLSKWPEPASIRTRNYIEVWVALDDECVKRLKTWFPDQMLLFLSLFYKLNVARVSDFCKKSLNKLASKAKILTTGQLVPTYFYIGIMRTQPFDMHGLELQVNARFQEFSADDLAIISMGMFKSRTPIRSMELASNIINKIIENKDNIHEVSLAALLKIIRLSIKIKTDINVYKLLEVLQHEVSRLSIMCIVHLALVGTSTLTLHKDCLTAIANKVINVTSTARVKDLERLILSYGTFNFMPPTKECLFQKVMEELRKPEREMEIKLHGRSFNCCISFLSLLGFYPVDLMSKGLSPELLEQTYGKQCYGYGREVLAIHNSAEIFCKEAKMNRLTEKVAKILAKKYTDYVPSSDYRKQYNHSEKMFLDVYHILEKVCGGSEYVTGDHIVTHHQRGDIIICNNHEGLPMPVSGVFNNSNFGLLRRPPDDNDWIVLVIAGRNALIQKTDTPTGHFQSKVIELQALGFHATLVPWSIYSTLETENEKSEYLINLIKNALKK